MIRASTSRSRPSGAKPGVDHLGFQTDDADELAALKARAEAADMALLDEGQTTGHLEIVELLEKRVAASARSLLAAVQARNVKMVQKLVQQGVPVNVREAEFGYTALSWAAEKSTST